MSSREGVGDIGRIDDGPSPLVSGGAHPTSVTSFIFFSD